MIVESVLWFLPAYVANSSATLSSKLFKSTHPIDGGLTYKGSRLLGDGKSVEGFLLGVFMGTLTGAILGNLLHGLLLSFFAMTGDVVGSFVKRRLNLKRGEEAPVIDQLDFVAIPLIFYPPPRPEYAVIILFITPVIHRVANIVGYKIGLKREPW